MKTTDFNKPVTSALIESNLVKHFGAKVNLEKYDREQLEDIRNKLRTRIFQQEGQSKMNDLLTNEAYQKDKAMLELLNIRIKEMLGEQMQKLRDKIDQLTEGKKDFKIAKHPKGAKKATKDYDGDGKVEAPKDEVWGSRAKAAAKAGHPFKEAAGEADDKDRKPAKTKEREVTLPSGAKVKARTVQGWQSQKADKEAGKDKNKDLDEGAKECNHSAKGEKCPVHGLKECGMFEGAKPDFLDMDKDGNKKETMKKAVKDKKKKVKESIFKHNVRFVNESINFLLQEDEEAKAKTITAAGDIVNDYTSWMQRVGQYQTKAIIELADSIRADFGQAEAETFKQTVAPALSATLETLTQQREAISNAVAALAGGAAPAEPMGADPMGTGMEPGLDAAAPDEMNPDMGGDEFGASDAAAGGDIAAGREMRESKQDRVKRKLAEAHSLMSKLAK